MSTDYLSKQTSNPLLTSYATGIAEEQLPIMAGLADALAPRTPVLGRSFRHAVWDPKVQFQLPPVTNRPLGGAAHRVAFGSDQVSRVLNTHGLDVVIDDMERRNAEGATPFMLEKMKINTLVMAALRAHLMRVVTAVDTGIGAATGGVWSTMTNDPIGEVNVAASAIQLATGSYPNVLILGAAAWLKFANNTITINRLKGSANRGIVSPADTLGGFVNPSLRVVIAETLYDSAGLGLAASLARIIGSVGYLLYNSPNPTESDASYAKTFFNAGLGLLQVGAPYRDPEVRSDVYPMDWDALTVVTNASAGLKFTVS